MKLLIQCCLLLILSSCANNKPKENSTIKVVDGNLPTIGILIFEGVIMNEVMAPLDVFSNSNKEAESLFNVLIIAKENKTYHSAHGLKVSPDFILNEIPKLDVLVIPSSYTPEAQTSDKALISFIQAQNETTEYIASHCAGAFLIGAAGIADHQKIVTYVGGGASLKHSYPNLEVLDDQVVGVAEDGKFISSNGSLVSYEASLNLLEKMTSKAHRKYVETSLLFDRIK